MDASAGNTVADGALDRAFNTPATKTHDAAPAATGDHNPVRPSAADHDPGRQLSVFDGVVDRRRPRSFRSLDSREHSPEAHGGPGPGPGANSDPDPVTTSHHSYYTIARRRGPDVHDPPDAGGIEDDYNLLPNRWWFAASAFPMIAGTIGPVASAFSICALVRPWRQEILPGETIATAVFLDDPHWLTAINAVQLAIALVANAVLLLNMTRRLRFSIAQPITIAGWYFSSLVLVALLATGAGPLRVADPAKHMVWSQAFYYAIYAALLYFVVASLMSVTFAGAWTGHYAKDFQLTNSQRTLMLQTILFLTYLLVGALIFCTIEDWSFLDAVYWADITLFTVGFGDLHPDTPLGRALLFPYALVGVISLGLVIGSIRSLMLERGKRRMDARMTEKNRRRVLQRLIRKGHDALLQPIHDAVGDGSGDGDDHHSDHSGGSGGGGSGGGGRSHHRRSRHLRRRRTEYERREAEFNMMRAIQHDAARKRRWLAMATSGTTWVLLWVVGAWIFQASEAPYQQWNYFDGFYLAFVSLTTIGYGDMVPQSNAGRSFFVFWSLLALPTTTVLISDAGDTIVKAISDATLAVGRITILPGERGLKRDLKAFLRATTCGVLFDDVDIEEALPGLLGAAQEPEDVRAAEAAASDAEDAAEAAQAVEAVEEAEREKSRDGAGGEAERSEKSGTNHPNPSTPRVNLPQTLPATRADYHYVLVQEIAAVTQHLRHSPPRKYSFQEWAWFLKLIGEDERDADLHRRARAPGKTWRKTETEPAAGADGADAVSDPEDPRHLQWSWVGARSPLMSSQEEAEWVLDKLTRRLQAELRSVRDAERGRRPGRPPRPRPEHRRYDGDPDPYRDASHRGRE